MHQPLLGKSKRDWGRGIPMERLNQLREASSETGVGLAGMRERVNELNGKLEIESDGHGCMGEFRKSE
jgi:signal transduction histidine kinase